MLRFYYISTIFVIYLELCIISCTIQNDPIVAVTEGKLRGKIETLLDGTSYYSFKGIPFASPPIGDLRFQAPTPPSPWKDIRNATSFGSICTQFNSFSQNVQGQEDCLFLNVYTKSLNKNAKMPVMVYIYGGSFTEGSSNFYRPEFLIQHDVVIVTFNYRLEVLGFLSLDTPEVPGNAAMKDQVAVLKWVNRNIIKFGGDPNNITLFGESAGALCVFLHMLSPMSKGLFHKAITQSGTFDFGRTNRQGAKERAFRAGKLLGKETNDVNELLRFFRSLTADKLTNLTTATFTANETNRGLIAKFLPIVEKKFPGVEAFLDEDPSKLILEGNLSKVPFILGYNSGEGLILVKYHIARLDAFNKDPSLYVPKEIFEEISHDRLVEFGNRVKNFYFGNGTITDKDSEAIRDIMTDTLFAYTTHRLAYLYASLHESTYMYRFDLETELNVIKKDLGLNLKGVSHVDDIFYLFNNELNQKLYDEKQQLRDVVYKVTKLWTNFAKTSNPTPDNSLGAKWHPYTTSRKEYFKINDPFTSGCYADRNRIEFWDQLYKEAGLLHICDN